MEKNMDNEMKTAINRVIYGSYELYSKLLQGGRGLCRGLLKGL